MKKMGNGKQGKVGSKEGLVKLVDAMRDVPAMDLDVEKWTVTDYDTVVGTEYSHSSGVRPDDSPYRRDIPRWGNRSRPFA